MATTPENKNQEEKLASTDPLLSTKIIKNIAGLPPVLVYPISDADFTNRQNIEDNNNYLRPNKLTFEDIISNSVEVSGIKSFTAFNDYIHYQSSARWNVYNNLISGAVQWEIYSRQYR